MLASLVRRSPRRRRPRLSQTSANQVLRWSRWRMPILLPSARWRLTCGSARANFLQLSYEVGIARLQKRLAQQGWCYGVSG